MEREEIAASIGGAITAIASSIVGLVSLDNSVNALVVGFSGALGGLTAKYIFELLIKSNKNKKNKNEKAS